MIALLMIKNVLLPAILLAVGGFPLRAIAAEPTADSPVAKKAPKSATLTLRGQVVWLGEAIKSRYGIETGPEGRRRQVALEADDGQLHPIVEDVRGRAFLKDERLRDVPVELVVRRYEGAPLVQIIRAYRVKEEQKYELDYWCDICAIPMYELKECECCQGPIRLRETLVK